MPARRGVRVNYTVVVYGEGMLAGIVISVVVVAGLAVAVPWLFSHRETPDAVDGDPTERFSDSMRIVRRDVIDYVEDHEGIEISTPLIRRAELTELRLLARSAARRRARVAGLLLFFTLVVTGLWVAGIFQWWSIAIPGGLLLVFLGVSPFMVRAMNQRFDARAARLAVGYEEEELTEVISLGSGSPLDDELTLEVDLSAPEPMGSLWEAVPVTTPTYVSKPLAPRTVRTIDLSSPVTAVEPIVPTADHPEADVEVIELEDTEAIRPRAVGE